VYTIKPFNSGATGVFRRDNRVVDGEYMEQNPNTVYLKTFRGSHGEDYNVIRKTIGIYNADKDDKDKIKDIVLIPTSALRKYHTDAWSSFQDIKEEMKDALVGYYLSKLHPVSIVAHHMRHIGEVFRLNVEEGTIEYDPEVEADLSDEFKKAGKALLDQLGEWVHDWKLDSSQPYNNIYHTKSQLNSIEDEGSEECEVLNKRIEEVENFLDKNFEHVYSEFTLRRRVADMFSYYSNRYGSSPLTREKAISVLVKHVLEEEKQKKVKDNDDD
jgi:hypothetical protein